MNTFFKRYVSLFLLMMPCVAGISQPADLKFHHLNMSSGLPGNQVSAVVKDGFGYMWIGTNEGLCRYDGSSMFVFRNKPGDTTSLPDNFISSLALTKNNRLFIGTSRGVFEYSYKKNAFSRLNEPGETKPTERLRKIFLLDSRDNLWIYESGKPLLLYNINSGKSRELNFYREEKELKMLAVYEARGGHYWISCSGKFFNYDINNDTYRKFSNFFLAGADPNSITSFFENDDRSIWCTTLLSGLVHFNPANGNVQQFLYDSGNGNKTTDGLCDCLQLISDEGRRRPFLWMATPHALFSFDTIIKKFTAYRQDVYNSFSCKINFSQRTFLGLYFDSTQKNLWYYGPNGIDICGFNEQYIQSFFSISEQQKIPFTEVRSFIQNKADLAEYFIGCSNSNSIFIYNEKSREIKVKPLPLKETGINALLQLSDNVVWLANGNTVYQWDPLSGTVKDISAYFKDGNCNCNGTKICLFKDSHGAIWIGTKGEGLCRYDLQTQQVQWYNQYNDNANKIDLNFVPAVVEDARGKVYAIEYAKGLYQFSENGKFEKKFTTDKINNHKLTTAVNTFFDIAAGPDNYLWITTYQGLLQFDISRSAFNLFNEDDKLPYGASNKVVVDKQGVVWADYRSFFIAFDPATKKNKVFDYRNGYTGAQDGSCLLLNVNGNIRIAYSNRVDAVNVNPFNIVPGALPPVLITSIQTANRIIPVVDTAGNQTLVQVYHDDNELDISYSLPLFSNTGGFVYYYKLDGYDKGWIISGAVPAVKYANLPGGDYTFHVKAVNESSGQSSSITSLQITVHPPFYKTWWFIGLCILLIAGFLYMIYRYRVQQLLRLERMRSSISSDLHDEVGATLSSISIYSNVAKKIAGTDTIKTQDYLSKIEDSSREMIEKMSDIVWSINPANDSVEKMVVRMRSYAYEILGAKNVKVNWQEEAGLIQQKLSMEQRKNLYLFFKEAVNNTAKYAQAAVVDIQLNRQQNKINLSITDDGIGFANTTAYNGNGLKNMRFRADLLKGEFDLQSAPGKGTAVSLSFPA